MTSKIVADVYFELSSGVWTSVAGDLAADPPLTIDVGIRSPGPNALVAEPGYCTFALRDIGKGRPAGYYAPFNANCRSGFALNMQVIIILFGAGLPDTYAAFKGRLMEIDVATGRRGERITKCRAVDGMGNLATTALPICAVQQDKRYDELITTLMGGVGTDNDYSVIYTLSGESGSFPFLYAFDSMKSNAMTIREELHRIAASERGHIYYSSYGAVAGPADVAPKLICHNQSHDTGSGVYDLALDDSTGMSDLTLTMERDDIIQKVEVTVYPVTIDAAATTVLYSLAVPNSTVIQPGALYNQLFGPFRDPNNPGDRIGGMSFAAVTATTDYTFNSVADGSGTDLTANFTVTANTTSDGVRWIITNTGTTAGYITKLQLRGKGVYRRTTILEKYGETTYGSRVLRVDMPYCDSVIIGQETADKLADLYGNVLNPRVKSVRFLANASSTLATFAVKNIGSSLGNLVTVTETASGLSGSQHIMRGYRQELLASGHLYTTLYLENDNVAAWFTPTFASGNFTASSGSWTVDSGDVNTYAYLLIGKTMTLSFWIVTTTVSGTAPTALRIAVPASKTIKKYMSSVFKYKDKTTQGIGGCFAQAGNTYIELFHTDSTATWDNTATNQTEVYGEITFEIQ